ncbi:hypothetical protein C8F04DRAFT_1389877 [Mycena alexandri]|uniref:Uncharacterized protein n=1 Tax=Mycena alexandri TaxID=1745969 RepID=A0AAD6TCN4_9AGAR|nr:hypothetical protein C8F04DRAFT_1389877 [Mycena alexandri]
MTFVPEVSTLLTSGSPLSTSISSIIAVTLILPAITAALIHYASPWHLTRVLVDIMEDTEETYLEGLETGLLLASDIRTAEVLSSLQLKVSNLREANLRSSLSCWATFREFFTGHTITLLSCIWQVYRLQVHLEILKEKHLRENDSIPVAIRAVPLYWRRLGLNSNSHSRHRTSSPYE